VKFWIEAPVKKHVFSSTIRNWKDGHLPPQPVEKFIEIDDIVKALGRDGLSVFIAIDHVVSLLPNSLCYQIAKTRSSRGLSIIRDFCKKIKNHVGEKRLKLTDLRSEEILSSFT